MAVVDAKLEPLTFIFKDDGLVPNNAFPFLVYKAAIDVDTTNPEKTIEPLANAAPCIPKQEPSLCQLGQRSCQFWLRRIDRARI